MVPFTPSAKTKVSASKDATSFFPIVEQTVGFDKKHVDKIIMMIQVGLYIKHLQQLDVSISDDGSSLRLALPHSPYMSNVCAVHEDLKKAKDVDSEDVKNFYNQMEQHMKKKRKTKHEVPYEVCEIKLVQNVDASVAPWVKIIRKQSEGVSVIYIVLTLPCNTSYDNGGNYDDGTLEV